MKLNATNLKLIAEVMITNRLNAIENGEVKMNVANQFDESVCESALAVLSSDEEAVAEVAERFKHADMNNVTAMTLAHALSSYEAPELDSAWVD